MLTQADAINWLIRDVVRKAAGMEPNTVRPANQNAPVGSADQEFATVLITSMAGSADGTVRYSSGTQGGHPIADHIVDDIISVSASVQFFKSALATDEVGEPDYSSVAFDRAMRLPQLMQNPNILQLMAKYGLGWMDAGPAQNLTAVVDAIYESRAKIDLEFAVANRETFRLAVYETIGIQIKVQEPDGTEDTITIEVQT